MRLFHFTSTLAYLSISSRGLLTELIFLPFAVMFSSVTSTLFVSFAAAIPMGKREVKVIFLKVMFVAEKFSILSSAPSFFNF